MQSFGYKDFGTMQFFQKLAVSDCKGNLDPGTNQILRCNFSQMTQMRYTKIHGSQQLQTRLTKEILNGSLPR